MNKSMISKLRSSSKKDHEGNQSPPSFFILLSCPLVVNFLDYKLLCYRNFVSKNLYFVNFRYYEP